MMGKFDKLLSKMGFHVEEAGGGVDLVCGMEIPAKTKYRVTYKNKEYFFCSENCRGHFEMDPEKYTG